jgi:hypothetical protein
MGRWVIALVVVAAALAAPPSLAQGVLAHSVFRAADLPSNAITTFTVVCPAGFFAASGGISSPASGVTTLGIRPRGVRSYVFRFGNPVTNPDQQVTVAVACRKFLIKGAVTPKLVPFRVKVTARPRKLTAADFKCPPQTAPTGWGADIAPVRSQRYVPGPAARLSVRKASMSLRGFSFSIWNAGRSARPVTLYGTCLTVLRRSGAARERLHVRITTFRTPLRAGNQRVIDRCPRGWLSLAAGYALRSSLTEIRGAAALGARGRWWVASDAGGGATADLQLVCARLST